MDVLKYLLYKLRTHATECTLSATLVEDFIVTSGLEDSKVMVFLILSDFTAYTHSLGEDFHQAVVYLVYLLTQYFNIFSSVHFITYSKD